jgi:hypothetical protein
MEPLLTRCHLIGDSFETRPMEGLGKSAGLAADGDAVYSHPDGIYAMNDFEPDPPDLVLIHGVVPPALPIPQLHHGAATERQKAED